MKPDSFSLRGLDMQIPSSPSVGFEPIEKQTREYFGGENPGTSELEKRPWLWGQMGYFYFPQGETCTPSGWSIHQESIYIASVMGFQSLTYTLSPKSWWEQWASTLPWSRYAPSKKAKTYPEEVPTHRGKLAEKRELRGTKCFSVTYEQVVQIFTIYHL